MRNYVRFKYISNERQADEFIRKKKLDRSYRDYLEHRGYEYGDPPLKNWVEDRVVRLSEKTVKNMKRKKIEVFFMIYINDILYNIVIETVEAYVRNGYAYITVGQYGSILDSNVRLI